MLRNNDENETKMAEFKMQKHIHWPQIYDMYKYIRHLCKILNKTYGQMLSLYLADCTFFFSTNLDSIFTNLDVSRRYQLFMFIAVVFTTFVLAADVPEQVSEYY